MQLSDVLLAVHWQHNQPAGWDWRHCWAEPWQGPGPGECGVMVGFSHLHSAVILHVLLMRLLHSHMHACQG